MAQYIGKAAVVEAIEGLSAYLDSLHEQRIIEKILSIIDTLEVKEVVAEQEGICNGIFNCIIGDTWHIKIPLDKAGLKHRDKVKIFITKEK